MLYEYAGYLKEILYATEDNARGSVEAIVFGPTELAQWAAKDLCPDKAWSSIPASRIRREDCVRLMGRFEDVRRIDILPADHPGFWAPLTSLGAKDDRFPIDLRKFPIFEITYRCASDTAFPEVVWGYAAGLQTIALPPSQAWRTVALRIPHFGFPETLDTVTVRLRSTSRVTQSMDIASIRFRAMTPAEEEALRKADLRLEAHPKPKHFDILDQFLPLGVCMDAASARRLTELLGLSLPEYWGLTLEDIVKHHHNCVAIENVNQLSAGEKAELLHCAETYGMKLVLHLAGPQKGDADDWQEFIDRNVKPYADSDVVLGWSFSNMPTEEQFSELLQARQILEKADEKHPLCILAQFSTGLPLYAPHFSVSGLANPSSHVPWDLGRIVREHVPLLGGQQLWVEAPTHVYATGSPEWSSCPEVRLMVNLGFANGARGWFSRYYHNEPVWMGGTYERSLTGPFLAFSDLWAELDNAMERFVAVAPMLLHTRPAALPKHWFVKSRLSSESPQMPEGMEATSSYRLRGEDFNLHIVISNDIRGMVSADVDIPPALMKDYEMYDLTDFVRTRTWAPMALARHVEMFPGQARMVLAGTPRVCAYWRDAIAWHLAEDDRRQLVFNMELARAYGLHTGAVERIMHDLSGDDIAKLELMDRARDMLVDLIYGAPAIAGARKHIISATAAICACDGVLCRVMGRGKTEIARELGLKVIPLAREFTHLRLELRQGRAAQILEHCADLDERCQALLAEIRKSADPPTPTFKNTPMGPAF